MVEKERSFQKYSFMLERALSLTVTVMSGIKDKGGLPYIFHCIYVMENSDSLEDKIIGILHDVVEDTSWTCEMLRGAIGLTDELLFDLDCITKKEGEEYEAYINRVVLSSRATRVKWVDLNHNLQEERLRGGSLGKGYYRSRLKSFYKIKGELDRLKGENNGKDKGAPAESSVCLHP